LISQISPPLFASLTHGNSVPQADARKVSSLNIDVTESF